MNKRYSQSRKLTLVNSQYISCSSCVRSLVHIILAMFLAAILLSGCMIPTNYKSRYVQPDNLNLEELAVINFYRTDSSFLAIGSGNDKDIYIDGNIVAELATGNSISVNVIPGVHKITTGSWGGGSKLPVAYYTENKNGGISHNFLKGKQYYIRWKDPSFTSMFKPPTEKNYGDYFLTITTEEFYNERK